MTVTHNDNQSIIGRAEINDIDAILAIPLCDPGERQHATKNNADTLFTWDYSLARPGRDTWTSQGSSGLAPFDTSRSTFLVAPPKGEGFNPPSNRQ